MYYADSMIITFCSLMYYEIFTAFAIFQQVFFYICQNHKNRKNRQFSRGYNFLENRYIDRPANRYDFSIFEYGKWSQNRKYEEFYWNIHFNFGFYFGILASFWMF